MRHRWLFLLLALFLAANAWAAPVKNAPVPKTLTLDFKEGDVRDILRAIGTQFKLNIVIDQNVTGNVTVHLENAPVIEGLRMLLESNGYSMEQKGEIYYVRKLDASRFMNIKVEGDRLWLDVRNKDIHEVLREISTQGKINLVADQSVKGEISGLLHQVPLESGLMSLLSANGYLLRKKTGIYEVTKAGGDPGRRKSMSLTVEKFQAADTTVKSPEYLVTMEVNDADLGSVMQEISSQAGFSVVTYGDIRGNVNAKLDKMPLDEAMNLVFQGTNYTYKKIGDPSSPKPIFLIGDKSPNSAAAQALTSSQLIKLQHIKADGIPGLLPPTIPQANIKVIKEQNALLMTGTEDQIQQLREFIRQIDITSPQIMIECLVVELSKRSSLELGFKGGFFKSDSAQMAFPRVSQYYTGNDINRALDDIAEQLRMGSLGKLPADFMLTIDALEIAGKAKVRARPRITTLNGNQASINVGWVRYYQTSSQTPQGTITQLHSIDAGITLNIVPWGAASGEITTEIHPTVSNLSGIGAGGLPEISRRNVDTTIRLKDGETIVIGGLIQKSSANSKEKIPFLGDIPFLGTLFSKTSSTADESELVIYITPHILPTGE
jgi:type IV pilus assembly protein PilQ